MDIDYNIIHIRKKAIVFFISSLLIQFINKSASWYPTYEGVDDIEVDVLYAWLNVICLSLCMFLQP